MSLFWVGRTVLECGVAICALAFGVKTSSATLPALVIGFFYWKNFVKLVKEFGKKENPHVTNILQHFPINSIVRLGKEDSNVLLVAGGGGGSEYGIPDSVICLSVKESPQSSFRKDSCSRDTLSYMWKKQPGISLMLDIPCTPPHHEVEMLWGSTLFQSWCMTYNAASGLCGMGIAENIVLFSWNPKSNSLNCVANVQCIPPSNSKVKQILNNIAISPDGQWVGATGENGHIYLLYNDNQSGILMMTFDQLEVTNSFVSLEFTFDGKWLIALSTDNRLLWINISRVAAVIAEREPGSSRIVNCNSFPLPQFPFVIHSTSSLSSTYFVVNLNVTSGVLYKKFRLINQRQRQETSASYLFVFLSITKQGFKKSDVLSSVTFTSLESPVQQSRSTIINSIWKKHFQNVHFNAIAISASCRYVAVASNEQFIIFVLENGKIQHRIDKVSNKNVCSGMPVTSLTFLNHDSLLVGGAADNYLTVINLRLP